MKGIITLCGSTKFKKEFNDLNYAFTLDDWIVLSVGSFLHSDNDPEIKEDILAHKEQLDILHKEKIMISQIVVIIDKDNYIGESTKSELEFARKLGKKIYFYTSLQNCWNPKTRRYMIELDGLDPVITKVLQEQ